MKPASLIMILLLAATSLSAQRLAKIEPCRVTPEQMPKIRGLYLGMPFADVKAMFKNLYSKPPEENGLRVALLRDILVPEFSDVKEITFVFFDDELCKIELTYKSRGDKLFLYRRICWKTLGVGDDSERKLDVSRYREWCAC